MYFFGGLNIIGLICCIIFIPNMLNQIGSDDEDEDSDIEND